MSTEDDPTIRITRAESESERALAHEIRHAVFVLEQGVPREVELDGRDGEALHFLAWVGARAVATARVRKTVDGHKLERVAVLEPQRGRRVGEVLVRHVLLALPSQERVYVHAQSGAVGFWERLGFVADGPGFVEGGIAHRYMALRSSPGS
ncbi:MAG: GNAT family N-acetyltransferase [Polyangiaceae bacterium]